MSAANDESSAEGATSNDELGCPSCGGAKVVPMRSMFGAHYYECLGCGRMSSLFGHATQAEAKAAWKTGNLTLT